MFHFGQYSRLLYYSFNLNPLISIDNFIRIIFPFNFFVQWFGKTFACIISESETYYVDRKKLFVYHVPKFTMTNLVDHELGF